ncbi:hypothetical protein BDY21DRAFT_292475 [Lineolata rhizophorae]|uniref:Cep57 centrosome microtubule-binding domain-containing protein n=1 Tax=Lineolata rhizophorae TaxID=578093 RepID=A0A6A6NR76_9PEZI|nr:hypothetical protein BDY21DRAFT_292475 [Lineolata rhizophorae]
MGYYNPPEPQPRVDTSVVNREFKDFDQEGLSADGSSDSSMSIEIGRGARRSVRGTPTSKRDVASSFASPKPSRSATNDRPNAGETGSLRRDAQVRRASAKQTELDGATVTRAGASSNAPRRASTLAEMHARVSEEESSILDERPPTVTLNVKNSRFGNPRSRQSSGTLDAAPSAHTPKRPVLPSAHSAPATGNNGTAQSFMLPDLPNLTELVSGVYGDGTPVFSRNTKSRARFGSRSHGSRYAIEEVAPTDEDKAIYASLQLLREKIAELEQDKAESDRRIEDYESEVIALKAELQAQHDYRRPDSGLGSEGEGSKRNSWQAEKSKLQASIASLQNKFDRAERKASVADINVKRITEERDSLVTQIGVAYYNNEELKGENDALRDEIGTLRDENDGLRRENSTLRRERDEMERKLGRKETAVRTENETLRAELARVRAQHDEEVQEWTRRETQFRSKGDRSVQIEHAKLRAENDALKAQLAEASRVRDQEVARLKGKGKELRDRVDRRDETIRNLQQQANEHGNQTLRTENERLRHELATMKLDRDEDTHRWAKTEAHLRSKIERREDTFRDAPTVSHGTAKSIRRRLGGHRGGETNAGHATTIGEEPRKTMSTDAVPSGAELSSNLQPTAYASSKEPQARPTAIADESSSEESTTDLSMFKRARAEKKRERAAIEGNGADKDGGNGPTQADVTLLSFLDPNEIANLRKKLEEERIASRHRSAEVAPATRDEDTGLSMASVPARRSSSLPQKPALKDVTSNSINVTTRRSFTAPAEEITNLDGDEASENERAGHETANREAKQEAEISIASNTGRRRRSAPTDMTSAFILPDITLHGNRMTVAEKAVDVPNHKSTNCTVCRRSSCNGHHPAAENRKSIDIPAPVPVSARMPDDVDATIRPSQAPGLALATVIKELQDELAHLKARLTTYEALLRQHDASIGKRKRKALQAKIAELLQAIDVKSDQVYALYDVVEGQKRDGVAAPYDVPEEHIDETLMSVGIDPEEMRERAKKNGKKTVVIEGETSRRPADISSEESDQDLPWEGISETESLTGKRSKTGGSFY